MTQSRIVLPMIFTLVASLFAGCTTVRLEYDRMTGTAFPVETTFGGQTVNFTSIFLKGNIFVEVMQDETTIAPLTGPANPADPNQYDYITPAEIDSLVTMHRASPIGSISWVCSTWGIVPTMCTRYHAYGLVVNHFEEKADGTRSTGTLGLMYDSTTRSGFVNYYKNSTVSSHNQKYLRSAAHELGHAFNLNHCDGDGATTIMNQTGVVGNNYTYEFSAASLDHLQNHNKAAVWPGIGPRHYACPHAH
ncbi:MAG TPA: hypothetical protein PKD12_02760 [Nitrospira sp.]|nr:hypothetical protein [Nitrospira sp.]